MEGKDYYKILGVNRDATDKDIKAAYRKMARKYHPDVNPGDKSAESRFKEINEAFEVLSDTEKRKKFDTYGDQWQHAEQFARARAQQQPQWNYSSGNEDTEYGETESVFDDLFRGFGRSRRDSNHPRAGEDVEYAVEVTLEEAYQGTGRILNMQGEEACSGCNGTGRVHNLPCSVCRGTGRVRREKRIEVKIPPGVTDGSRVRFAGQGSPGYRGGPNGDLYLVVSVLPHKIFERKEDNLYVTVDVPLLTAILGGEIQVPTLKGNLMLKIPPETQNGKIFNLAGQGMPHLGDSTHGSLLVKVNVVIPTGLTPQEKELFKQLSRLQKD